ncbi:MAG: lactate utilization protein, partial [Betaproteobacteria bacterium]|nr:lactate utilization protein [Betaproteobacteria bacterium]
IVHWAETAADVNRIVCELAAKYSVRKVVKSKSMVSEECALNDALEAAGVQVVETDLGEYILQLAQEPPSHIIAPVIHKGRAEIADLFEEKHHLPRKSAAAELTREAREMLRSHFLSADMGISGANFIVAETGTTLIVTNEGNGRMVTTLPRVHVAITGIEKVVPTLEDVTTLLRLLPRSATGQTISNYISFTTGVAPAGEDGPGHFHIILLDAGRTRLIGGDMQPMLRCIRCGACMNHCPVYQSVGGHAYGWVYPGPMGSILTPTYVGLENALDLPHASTMCNQCGVVCPVKIPLPDLMRKLREKQFERGLRPWVEYLGLGLWGWAARRPALYALLSGIGVRILSWMGGAEKLIHHLPLGGGWTAGRDMPAPQGKTFRELYARKKRQS